MKKLQFLKPYLKTYNVNTLQGTIFAKNKKNKKYKTICMWLRLQSSMGFNWPKKF